MHDPYKQDKIIFFDGVCVLCNRSIDFILKKDHKRRFKFASIQSEFASDFFKNNQIDRVLVDSIIFYDEGKIFIKSTAVLKIAGYLGLPWSIAVANFIIPLPIRDWIYDVIARKRFRWFGRRLNCRIPDESTSGRIIA